MKAKILVIISVIALFFVLIALNEYSKDPLAWCFESKSKCALAAMEKLRKERDSRDAQLKQQIAENQAHFNPKISAIKLTLDGATIQEELQAGRKENVPEGILSLRGMLIPQANAASGDVLTSDTTLSEPEPKKSGGVRFGNAIPVGRYGEVLAELGSPYAAVPIEKYCNKEQIPAAGCDVLVGIAHAESKSGTDFRCNYKTWEQAVNLGQTVYFNPVGRFTGQYVNGKKLPDENGCYLEKFASWDSFWEFYTNRMANNIYEFKTRTEPQTMYLRYVKGDFTSWDRLTTAQKNTVLNTPWVKNINWFVNKVRSANF